MSNSESILSNIGDESTAISAVTTQVTLIVTEVNAATASVEALALSSSEAASLQAALTTLLTDINGIV
jgi:hypothetical protein